MGQSSTDRIARNLERTATIVFIDNTETSKEYFNVLQMPAAFKLGSNIVKIPPNQKKLQAGTNVEFEFMASDGKILRTETKPSKDNTGASEIEVFVISTTAPEAVEIKMLGTAKYGTIPSTLPQSRNIFWSF